MPLTLRKTSIQESRPLSKKLPPQQPIENTKLQNEIKQMYQNLSPDRLAEIGYKWYESICREEKYEPFYNFEPGKQFHTSNEGSFAERTWKEYSNELEDCKAFGKVIQSLVLDQIKEDEAYWLVKKRQAETGWTYWNISDERYYGNGTVTVEALKRDWKEFFGRDEEDRKTLQEDYDLITTALSLWKDLLVSEAKLRSL